MTKIIRYVGMMGGGLLLLFSLLRPWLPSNQKLDGAMNQIIERGGQELVNSPEILTVMLLEHRLNMLVTMVGLGLGLIVLLLFWKFARD